MIDDNYLIHEALTSFDSEGRFYFDRDFDEPRTYQNLVWNAPLAKPSEQEVLAALEQVRMTRDLNRVLAEIKRKAEARITTPFPIWKQSNDLARLLNLTLIGQDNWTTEQADEVAALQARRAWIDSVRAASDVIETEYLSHPTEGFDVAGNAAWPEAFA